MKYIIGSRGSRLALIQTKYVQEKLAKAYPEHSFEIEVIKTKGDKIQNKPLDKIGGKGLFVKELEEKIISYGRSQYERYAVNSSERACFHKIMEKGRSKRCTNPSNSIQPF